MSDICDSGKKDRNHRSAYGDVDGWNETKNKMKEDLSGAIGLEIVLAREDDEWWLRK